MKRTNIIRIYSKNRADKLKNARQVRDERNRAGEDFILRFHQREDERTKKRIAKLDKEVDLRASYMEPFFKRKDSANSNELDFGK